MNEYAILINDIVVKGFERVARFMQKQRQLDRRTSFVVTLLAAYAVVQHVEIKKLGDEVRELKQTRGE